MTLPIPADLFSRLVELRRDFHRHPELSWKETRTAAVVAQRLEALGASVRSGIGGTGIIAEITGPRDAPVVALRADMDALPVQEETGLPFASSHPGVMHACGHDGHTAMLLGAAELLARESARPTPVRLLFQPAEEVGTGAPALIEAGALDRVAMIFGGHLDRLYPAGVIVAVEGGVNASTDEFLIELTGPGGHGARPHETVDPIVAASELVLALQTIVTREIDPTHAAVVSVGRFAAGTAPNVIAASARVEGTLRAQRPDVRATLREAVTRIAHGVARTHRVEATVHVIDSTPPVINHPDATRLAREAARTVVGEQGLQPMLNGNMGGEDFGFYAEQIPACFVRIGARPAGESYPAHSSRFDWDERALAYGVAYLHRVALVAGAELAGRE